MDINESTKVPLFVALGAVPIMVAAVLWIGSVSGKSNSNEDRLNRQADKIVRMETKTEAWHDQEMLFLIEIRERLVRIEAKQK